MSYMKRIHTAIITQYPEKAKELINDFTDWHNGKYALPRTKELRKILTDIEKGFIK